MSREVYGNYRLAPEFEGVLPGSRDAFSGFEDFDAAQALSHCITIPVTAAVRAADAAKRAERERLNVSPAQAWRDKVKLDRANLRTLTPAKASPGRVPDARKFVASSQSTGRAMRSCARGCGKLLEARSKHTVCVACRPHKGKVKPCAGCSTEFNRWSPYEMCRACRKAERSA